jgi:hypothetical protein
MTAMSEGKHKESVRGWALVAQQLAVAIHERQAAPARPDRPVRWYPTEPRRVATIDASQCVEAAC